MAKASASAVVRQAWELLRQRPVLLLPLGLLLQVPGLLIDWATPVNWDQVMAGNLSFLETVRHRLPTVFVVWQIITFLGWVGVTAVGLEATESVAPQGWLRRAGRGLLPTFGAFVLTELSLMVGFGVLLLPLVAAAWLQHGEATSAPADHMGFWLLALTNGTLALCALLVGATVFMVVTAVAVGVRAPVLTLVAEAWRLTGRHLWRLTVVLLLCQLLMAGVSLLSTVAAAVAGDTAATLVTLGAGAAVAPLLPLCGVCVFREDGG